MICDIKDSIEAWNHGINSFMNAMKISNNATKSIRYALKELSTKYPEMKFDVNSFTNPLIEKLKEEGLVKDNYTFKEKSIKQSDIDKIIGKFDGLTDEKAKELSKKIFEKSFKENGVNIQDIKNAYAEIKKYPHITPEFNKLIEQTATDRQSYEKIDNEVKSLLGEIQTLKKDKKYTPEKEKELSDKFKKLNKEKKKALEVYLKSDLAYGEILSKGRHWVYQGGDMDKMNLMSAVTLLKNNTGMAADWVFRSAAKLVAAPIELTVLGARRALGKTKANYNSITLLSHTLGAFKSNALNQAYLSAKYGTDPVYSDKIRTPNYIDASRNWKKIMNGDEKFKNSLAFALKISPTAITRGLAAPDALVSSMAETAELNRIGNEKGLKGAELKGFLMSPDEKSLNKAKEYGKLVTYKKDMPFSEYFNVNIDFAKIGDAMIENGTNPMFARLVTGLGHLFKNWTIPFTKTPINLLRTANRVILPEYVLLKGMIEAHNLEGDEKTHKIISTIAEAAVGFHIRLIALQLVSQTLISGGHDDEEQKTGEVIEKITGGFNRININAAMRGITMSGDVKQQKGDVYADINALGALGISFGAYQHAFGKYSKKEIDNQINYLKSNNFFTIPAYTAANEVSAGIDYSFMAGWNNTYKLFKGDKADSQKFAQEALMSTIGIILPAQHQILSKLSTESRPKTYDQNLSFSQNIYNTLGYRFMFQVPEKTYKVLTSTSEGEKPERIKEHFMFDNYWGRVLAATDPFKFEQSKNPNTPTAKLYNEMRKVGKKERDDLVPGFVSDKVKIKGNDILLTKDQHNYFQQQSSLHRMMLATPFIMSSDFDKMDYDEKGKVLQSLYEEGRSQALKETQEKYYPKIKRNHDSENRDVEKMSKKYKKKK